MRKTVEVDIGGVRVGGGNPVVVQSMTNTDTADPAATAAQVGALADAGSEIVRVTVNNRHAAAAVPELFERLADLGCTVPIVGDFHYNGHILLRDFPRVAALLHKYRINPGNVGTSRRDENFQAIVRIAIENGKAVRIGVNWGSLDQRLLTRMMDENGRRANPKDAGDVLRDCIVASATRSAELAVETGLGADRIVLSAKVSGVRDLILVYRRLAPLTEHPLHLGLTEAGMGSKGIVATAAALSPLLIEGIGDTIRVSLTPRPSGDRTEEVRVAQQILQSLEIRGFEPQVTACPGCGRTTSTFFQEMTEDIQGHIRERMPEWRRGLPGRGGAQGGGDGVRGERPRRIQACRPRDFVAGYLRGAEGAGLCGREASADAEGRPHRGGVQGDAGRLCGAQVRDANGRRDGGGGRLKRGRTPGVAGNPRSKVKCPTIREWGTGFPSISSDSRQGGFERWRNRELQ